MVGRDRDLLKFWGAPWSAPLRAACVWVARLGQPIALRARDRDAPRWLRPLCVQRWVGQAIAARLAWLAAHPEQTAYRFGKESEPGWTGAAWASYQRRYLREFDEATNLWLLGMEVERLLRIAQEAPGLVGAATWTRAVLGASEHVAQVYAELRRRHKAMPARALLREELGRFVEWAGEEGEAALPWEAEASFC